jgi:hypothetical protein
MRDSSRSISATKTEAPPSGRNGGKKPRHIPGVTELVPLDCKERRLVINAATQYYADKERNRLEGMDRLNRIKHYMDIWELHDFEATLAHQMNADKAAYIASMNSGKVSAIFPKLKSEQFRGDERDIVMPKTLFAILQEILKTVRYDPQDSEYVATLCKKFQLEIRDSSLDLPPECFA